MKEMKVHMQKLHMKKLRGNGEKFFQDDPLWCEKNLIAWLLFPGWKGSFRYISHRVIVDTLRLFKIAAE